MNNYIIDANTITGTFAGTLLVLFARVDTTQLFSTIILAGVGAAVSFLVSIGCRYVWKKINERSNAG